MIRSMSGTPSEFQGVLPYATPAAKPGAQGGVKRFAGDFLNGSACAFGGFFVLMCARYLWDYRAGRTSLGSAGADLPVFLTTLAVMTAASALLAAAGAGMKRFVLRSAVSSPRWAALAGGILSSAASLGSVCAFHHRMAWTLAVAAPVVAGFLVVRRDPRGDPSVEQSPRP
jgi:hypothetical protein